MQRGAEADEPLPILEAGNRRDPRFEELIKWDKEPQAHGKGLLLERMAQCPGQPHHIAHLPQGACSFSKPEPGQTLGQGHSSADQEDKHIQQTCADSHVCWEGRGATRQEESQTRGGEGGPHPRGHGRLRWSCGLSTLSPVLPLGP